MSAIASPAPAVRITTVYFSPADRKQIADEALKAAIEQGIPRAKWERWRKRWRKGCELQRDLLMLAAPEREAESVAERFRLTWRPTAA